MHQNDLGADTIAGGQWNCRHDIAERDSFDSPSSHNDYQHECQDQSGERPRRYATQTSGRPSFDVVERTIEPTRHHSAFDAAIHKMPMQQAAQRTEPSCTLREETFVFARYKYARALSVIRCASTRSFSRNYKYKRPPERRPRVLRCNM